MLRRSAPEYAGFLEWLWRLDNLPCEIVDLTDITVVGRSRDGQPTRPVPAICLAHVPTDQIGENGLFDHAERLPPTKRSRYHDIWGRLRAEDAPLRVVTADALVSAPMTFFDPLLLSCAKNSWQKAARVVGEALAKWADDELSQVGELVRTARVFALVQLGLLEARGDLINIQNPGAVTEFGMKKKRQYRIAVYCKIY